MVSVSSSSSCSCLQHMLFILDWFAPHLWLSALKICSVLVPLFLTFFHSPKPSRDCLNIRLNCNLAPFPLIWFLTCCEPYACQDFLPKLCGTNRSHEHSLRVGIPNGG